MKNKYALLSTIVLIIVVAIVIFGKSENDLKGKKVIKKIDVSRVLGKPVFEMTVDSLNTRVWIISQKENKKLMRTKMGKNMSIMKTTSMKMNSATKKAVMTGTHYFIFDVTNIKNKKEVADSTAKVQIVSPSKKISSVTLQPMMNHFGGGIWLTEKGYYLFTINLDIGSSYKTTQFKYRVR